MRSECQSAEIEKTREMIKAKVAIVVLLLGPCVVVGTTLAIHFSAAPQLNEREIFDPQLWHRTSTATVQSVWNEHKRGHWGSAERAEVLRRGNQAALRMSSSELLTYVPPPELGDDEMYPPPWPEYGSNEIMVVSTGWPLKTHRSIEVFGTLYPNREGWDTTVKNEVLVGRIVINALLMSAFLFLGLMALTMFGRLLTRYFREDLHAIAEEFSRREYRLRRGLCPRCSYDLRGEGSGGGIIGGCPECGWNRNNS